MARFLIRHPKTGEEYGLNSVTDYRKHYEERGFVIPNEQPNGWVAPDLKKTATADAPKRATKDAEGTKAGEAS